MAYKLTTLTTVTTSNPIYCIHYNLFKHLTFSWWLIQRWTCLSVTLRCENISSLTHMSIVVILTVHLLI